MALIDELVSYPVKGCAGVSVPHTELHPAGLAHDRAFMVTSDDGVFRSQRGVPELALIRPEINLGGHGLTLHGPGVEPVVVDVDTTAARRDVQLFGKQYRGIDQGDQVAAWLSEVLGTPSRLVRVPPEHDRETDGCTPGTAYYADSGAVHVLSRSSLDLHNQRRAQRGLEPLPMNRFRPNLVIAGWPEPHVEDRLRRITVGDTELGYTKLAIRCAVTTVDQESGAKTGPEPLRMLAEYRRRTGGLAFGVKFAVLRTGNMSVGDEVIVHAWDDVDD